jgi:hypothetical protein
VFILSSSSLSAFSFNGWHSGMTLENVQEANRLEYNKNFKSATCSGTCRDIYFTENILGAEAKITLHFTLNGKMLYKVEVLWGSGIKEEDMQRFTDELTAFLDKKYGEIKVGIRPNYNGFDTLKEKKWQPEPNTEIVARKGLSSLALILTDIELESNHAFEMSQFLKEKKK